MCQSKSCSWGGQSIFVLCNPSRLHIRKTQFLAIAKRRTKTDYSCASLDLLLWSFLASIFGALAKSAIAREEFYVFPPSVSWLDHATVIRALFACQTQRCSTKMVTVPFWSVICAKAPIYVRLSTCCYVTLRAILWEAGTVGHGQRRLETRHFRVTWLMYSKEFFKSSERTQKCNTRGEVICSRGWLLAAPHPNLSKRVA